MKFHWTRHGNKNKRRPVFSGMPEFFGLPFNSIQEWNKETFPMKKLVTMSQKLFLKKRSVRRNFQQKSSANFRHVKMGGGYLR
ncbi:MAG: hypothetical protein LBQ54_12170, partial [Planctomycetaceae bacterium]|nr:hypothetical protein [Planctomycetaceae bacterium]